MLGDLNDFVRENRFLSQNEKSFLFVLSDATYFHDDPTQWKGEDLRECQKQEPDNFNYPFELEPRDVCDIFKRLAQSFRFCFKIIF